MFVSSNECKHSKNLRSYVLAVLTLQKKTDIVRKSAPGSTVGTTLRREALGLCSIITIINNTKLLLKSLTEASAIG